MDVLYIMPLLVLMICRIVFRQLLIRVKLTHGQKFFTRLRMGCMRIMIRSLLTIVECWFQ